MRDGLPGVVFHFVKSSPYFSITNQAVKILTNCHNLLRNPLHWPICVIRWWIPHRVKVWRGKTCDNQTVSRPWLSRISDTSENKPESLDSDNQINISRLISFLDTYANPDSVEQFDSSPQSQHESQGAHRTWISSTHRCQTPRSSWSSTDKSVNPIILKEIWR